MLLQIQPNDLDISFAQNFQLYESSSENLQGLRGHLPALSTKWPRIDHAYLVNVVLRGRGAP
ncbi:hypothetical protein HanHA89_Chr04g0164171 [Helianthus annuus]|nr:hypothetical protein HanHA89_Chr04g0164171 [Helianthus annuus]